MNATVLLPFRKPAPPDDPLIAFDAPANDGIPAGRLGPETALHVSFDGLTEAETLRALRSFPGARRIILAAP